MNKKRYCIRNHDTWAVGRKTNSTCKQCERERVLKENLSEEQLIRKRQNALRYWHNRREEKIERDKIKKRECDDRRMADPIRRMKLNAKLRLKRYERNYRI